MSLRNAYFISCSVHRHADLKALYARGLTTNLRADKAALRCSSHDKLIAQKLLSYFQLGGNFTRSAGATAYNIIIAKREDLIY